MEQVSTATLLRTVELKWWVDADCLPPTLAGQIDARQWSEQGTDDNGEDPNGVECVVTTR